MVACYADKRTLNFIATHALCFVNRSRDRLRKAVDVADHTLLHSLAGFDPNPNHENIIGADFGDHRTDFICTYIKTDYKLIHGKNRVYT